MSALTDSEIDKFLEEPKEGTKLENRPDNPRSAIVADRSVMRRQRDMVGDLVASGLSTTAIQDVMAKPEQGALDESTVNLLVRQVRADWDEEDAERKLHYKSAAIRRLHKHIVKAQAAGAWPAVANLEKVLMQIQGTAEPLEMPMPVDSRLTEALLQVLGERDPRNVREMIEREKALSDHGAAVVKRLPSYIRKVE